MKKVFLGLLVAGVALAGSAFTNASKVNINDVYANTTGTSYTKVLSYDSNNCLATQQLQCAYRQVKAATIVTPLSSTDAQALVASGVLTPISNFKGIYQP